ncbi:uncharacterized protein JN550_011612 [Neoarthrinium moseri]|uniref:uncharacterized protein n=1 Tax=Neoarthrinium moseri TaxID=1658444 RepID=UPI001FDE7DF2|nr:uncharacterized protein JN550_011612 [Neoarthrinium moseri]KAI1860346.1 hypothetical protein JN550_011612 [Neoarthrinium moseri]
MTGAGMKEPVPPQQDDASEWSRGAEATSSDGGLFETQHDNEKPADSDREAQSAARSHLSNHPDEKDDRTNPGGEPQCHASGQYSPNDEGLTRSETHNSMRSRSLNLMRSVTSHAHRATGEITHDPIPETNYAEGIIAWDSQHDPEMPLNWPIGRKWIQVVDIAAIAVLTPFSSSALAPGIEAMMQEFGVTSEILGSFAVSIYLLGYSVGPLVLAPLSDMYGRKIVLDMANIMFCLWQIGSALSPNIQSLIVFRFLSGVGGSGCLTLGGGAVGDMFHPEQRGLAAGIWGLGVVIGPTLGPLVGGYLAATIGWRWTFWVTLIAGATVTACILTYNRETNYTVLINRKVARMTKERVSAGEQPTLVSYYRQKPVSNLSLLYGSLTRPTKLLFRSPIIFFISLYMAFVYGVLYLLYTTIPTVFSTKYGFSTGEGGLVFLSLGFGNIAAWTYITTQSDKQVVKQTLSNNNVFVPEMRLKIAVWFSCLLPVTFYWYGWVTQFGGSWPNAVVSLLPFGIGSVGVFAPFTTFLIDCYPSYASSVIAANTVFRSLFGAFLPLLGPTLYSDLGLGWGNTLLGLVCTLMIPIPMLFWKFGERLRARESFNL